MGAVSVAGGGQLITSTDISKMVSLLESGSIWFMAHGRAETVGWHFCIPYLRVTVTDQCVTAACELFLQVLLGVAERSCDHVHVYTAEMKKKLAHASRYFGH